MSRRDDPAGINRLAHSNTTTLFPELQIMFVIPNGVTDVPHQYILRTECMHQLDELTANLGLHADLRSLPLIPTDFDRRIVHWHGGDTPSRRVFALAHDRWFYTLLQFGPGCDEPLFPDIPLGYTNLIPRRRPCS